MTNLTKSGILKRLGRIIMTKTVKAEKLSKKGVALLQKVKQAILEEPKRLNMSFWGVVINPDNSEMIEEYEAPSCNTVGCIAGWTVLYGKPKVWADLQKEAKEVYGDVVLVERNINVVGEATKLLGLSDDDSGEADLLYTKLFYENNWDQKSYSAYHTAKTPKQRAKVTAKVIDNFIADHS